MIATTRVRHWPGWSMAGTAFGLGAVMASGQAPLGFWWLTLPALWALTLLIARASGTARAVWLGLFAGMGYFGLALSWIVEPFLIEPETYGWMAPFALIFIAFGFGSFWAAAAGVAHRLGGAGQGGRAVMFAVTLALVELGRGYLLTGFPWALIGHIWIGTPYAQLAALIGPNGLTLLATLIAAAPVFAGRWSVPIIGVVAVAGFVYGTTRPDAPTAADRPVVRLIQPNAEQHMKWDPDRAEFYLARNLELTAAPPAPGEPRPDLVVWPETAVPYLLETAGPVLDAIAQAANGAITAVGIQRSEGSRGWNSLAVIGPGGVVEDVYDKHHLVPFGEYIPFGDVVYRWFGLSAFASQTGNGYSAGTGAKIIDLGPRLGRALPLICYEAVFPQDLRAAPGRADFILQITNDAWFGKLTGPWQHLAQARLRAIEQGLPLIRAANTGISAVIDARGHILAELPLGVAGHLDARLPAALPLTPYARFGDLPVFLLLCGLFLSLAVAARRSRA